MHCIDNNRIQKNFVSLKSKRTSWGTDYQAYVRSFLGRQHLFNEFSTISDTSFHRNLGDLP